MALFEIEILLLRIRKLEDFLMSMKEEKAERLAESNIRVESTENQNRAKRIGIFDKMMNLGSASGREIDLVGREKHLE